jgi:hypothetical protein
MLIVVKLVLLRCLVKSLKSMGISAVSRSNIEIALLTDHCSACKAEVEDDQV